MVGTCDDSDFVASGQSRGSFATLKGAVSPDGSVKARLDLDLGHTAGTAGDSKAKAPGPSDPAALPRVKASMEISGKAGALTTSLQ